MRFRAFVFLFATATAGCMTPRQSPGPLTRQDGTKIRAVTFHSHLEGRLTDDPTVKLGETVRVIPHTGEPMSAFRESIIVQLPIATPFAGDKQQYYLRGYVIGQLSRHNAPFW